MLEYKHQKLINTEAVHCYISPQHFVLQRRSEKTYKPQSKSFLFINRETGYIKVIGADKKPAIENPSILSESGQIKTLLANLNKRSFSAFIGVAQFESRRFLMFVDQAKVVSTIDQLQIFEVSSLFFMPYDDEKHLKNHPQRQKIYRQIRQISALLSFGFYFSYSYKLTRSLQYQTLHCNNKFTWNKRYLDQLKHYEEWKTPIIQGFANFFEIILEGCKIEYLLISRRSTEKGGTRYFDRGINQSGYVANFVETEQIIKIGDYRISDVQIRGNAPLFFQQKGLTTKVRLTRGYQLTHQVYEKHLEKLKNNYFRVFIVNLLSKHKSDQRIIVQEYEKHIKDSKADQLKYYFFDFHEKVQGCHFENADQAVRDVAQMKRNLKFYLIEGDKVLQRPAGVFRTNCLDCLDRTNFFQAKVALQTFQDVLSMFGITLDKNLIEAMNDPLDERPIIKKFRNIWADNGDNISFHYTGTGSTHTDITRDGKRGWLGGFKHKYKSVTRFYNQNFYDFYKMRLVDLFLGKEVTKEEKIPALMMERQKEFCKLEEQQIYIFTWKVPREAPPSLPFFPVSPKIIAIGLQQVQNLQIWKKLINESIDQDKYVMAAEKNSNNNYLVVYAHRSIQKIISNVELTKVKFKSYYNKYFSTKCAVLIRICVYSTRIVFANCQLQYGKDSFQNRVNNLKQLHQYAFQEEVVGQKKSDPILDDDVIFLFGNMNCTIESGFANSFEVLDKVEKPMGSLSSDQKKIIRKMLDTDEFQLLRDVMLQYRYYDQEQIKFLPTYMKVNGKYDTEKSGWPDRIWISTENGFTCLGYGIVDQIKGEKHMPVHALYKINCDKIDQNARESVFKDIATTIVGVTQQQFERVEQEQREQSEERRISLIN